MQIYRELMGVEGREGDGLDLQFPDHGAVLAATDHAVESDDGGLAGFSFRIKWRSAIGGGPTHRDRDDRG